MELIPRIQEGGVFKNKQAINKLRHKEQLQDSKDFDVYHFHLKLILTGPLQTTGTFYLVADGGYEEKTGRYYNENIQSRDWQESLPGRCQPVSTTAHPESNRQESLSALLSQRPS